MNSYESMWEDDETSRRVELLVNYSQHDAGITINEITPIKVTFLCPTSKAARRTIGAHLSGLAACVGAGSCAGVFEPGNSRLSSAGLPGVRPFADCGRGCGQAAPTPEPPGSLELYLLITKARQS